MNFKRAELLALIKKLDDYNELPGLLIDYSGPIAWNISWEGYQGPDHLPEYCGFLQVSKADSKKIQKIVERLGKKLDDINVEDESVMKCFEDIEMENDADVSVLIKMLQSGCDTDLVYVHGDSDDEFFDIEEVFSERLRDFKVKSWDKIGKAEINVWLERLNHHLSKVGSKANESDSPYDEGFDAFNAGKDKKDNPYDPADEEWEEWNDGWDRGESDDGQRMNEYCCGGADWPWYKFKTTVLIKGKKRRAIIQYHWVDNSEGYYGPEPAHSEDIHIELVAKNVFDNEPDLYFLPATEQKAIVEAIKRHQEKEWEELFAERKKPKKEKAVPIAAIIATPQQPELPLNGLEESEEFKLWLNVQDVNVNFVDQQGLTSGLVKAIAGGDLEAAKGNMTLLQEAGYSAQYILSNGIETGLEQNLTEKAFLPQLMLSAKCARECRAMIFQQFSTEAFHDRVKILLVPMTGDPGRINTEGILISDVLSGIGLDVIELDKGAATGEISDLLKLHQPRLVVLSPTYGAYLSLDSCMHKLKENKYAGKTIVMGCETISKALALRTGADAYAKDLLSAVRLAKWLVEKEKSCSGYEQVRHLATDCLS